MTEEAKLVIESMKQALDVFEKMELPIKERKCTLKYDSVMAIISAFEQVTRERDAAIEQLVELGYPIPCESDELEGSEYCSENCRFQFPQRECWLRYLNGCGVEVE